MKATSSFQDLIDRNSNAHDLIAHFYDAKHHEIYNEIEQQRLEEVVDDLLRRHGGSPPSVLDFGAGTGNVTLKLLQRGCRVTALDVSAVSLDLLKRKAAGFAGLETRVLTNEELPVPDASFDIAVTYSVLHHVPNYLRAVTEMVRVVRPSGMIYIDHEASEQAWWECNPALEEYRHLARLRLLTHLRMLAATGELVTYDFWRAAFIKLFVNRRYQREGDLHVWPDDHIEWPAIFHCFHEHGVTVVRNVDYLLYQPRAGRAAFERYRTQCADTKLVFARR